MVEKQGGIENGARVVLRMGTRPAGRALGRRAPRLRRGRAVPRRAGGGPVRALGAHPSRHARRARRPATSRTASSTPCPSAPSARSSAARWCGGGWLACSTYRHRVTAQDVAAHARAGGRTMKILVTRIEWPDRQRARSVAHHRRTRGRAPGPQRRPAPRRHGAVGSSRRDDRRRGARGCRRGRAPRRREHRRRRWTAREEGAHLRQPRRRDEAARPGAHRPATARRRR